MSKTQHVTISLPFGEGFAQVTGYYTEGKRSNNYDEPDDPADFELESIVVGGVDITDTMMSVNKELRSLAWGTPEYIGWVTWWLGVHWESVLEQCEVGDWHG